MTVPTSSLSYFSLIDSQFPTFDRRFVLLNTTFGCDAVHLRKLIVERWQCNNVAGRCLIVPEYHDGKAGYGPYSSVKAIATKAKIPLSPAHL